MTQFNDNGYANGWKNTPHNMGDAIELLKRGERVARRGWNGKDMYLELDRRECGESRLPMIEIIIDGRRAVWAITHTDLLALDWYLVPTDE